MYLLCSDWSIRCLEKNEKEEEENCHLLITAVVPTRAVIKMSLQINVVDSPELCLKKPDSKNQFKW